MGAHTRANNMKLSQLTGKIIGSAQAVSAALGNGFLEKVYENALAVELCQIGFHVRQQHPFNVTYRGQVVGCFLADLVVDDAVIVELKAVPKLLRLHEQQLVNYLRASSIEVGLIINFGDRFEVRRKVYDSDYSRPNQ